MIIRQPIIQKEEYEQLKSHVTQNALYNYFLTGYNIHYIQKQAFEPQFFEQFLNQLLTTLEPIDGLTLKKLESLYQQHPLIVQESMFILLYQCTQNLLESPIMYKFAYIQIMEHIKTLFYNHHDNLALITICINQLLLSNKIKTEIKDINHLQTILEKDSQYLIELITYIIDDLDTPVTTTQAIQRQIFLINQEQQHNITNILFNNLHQILRYNQAFTYTTIQSIRIFIKSQNAIVFTQIRSFLEKSITYFQYDEICSKLTFQILSSLQKNIIFYPTESNIILEHVSNIFHLMWEKLQLCTNDSLYETKTEFWLNYVHDLNLIINPIAKTPTKSISEFQKCLGLYILLSDYKTLYANKYIITHNFILHFIDSIMPISINVIRSSILIQELIQRAVELTLTKEVEDNEGIFKTMDKVLKMVINLNMNQKQNVFQLIWKNWDPDNAFCIKILSQVIQNFLSSDQNCMHLGIRNNFLYSILALETEQSVIHPKKSHTILQIFQYLCLDNATIDLDIILSSNHTYSNIQQLQCNKIQKSFQEFFQVNRYFSMIISLIDNINDQNQLFSALKEFIKLTWLLTEGLKLKQIDFTSDFAYYIMRKIDSFESEQQREIQDLLIDCSTHMITYFLRSKLDKQEEYLPQYSQVIINNQFTLKILLEVFTISDCVKSDLQSRSLLHLAYIIGENQYNQQIFRETVCLSEMLVKQKKCKNKAISEQYQILIRKSLQFVLSDKYLEQIKKASQDSLGLKINKYFFIKQARQKVFRPHALSQYVGQTLEYLNQGQGSDDNKVRRQLQLLGKDSGILIKNFVDLTKKEWKSFTFLLEFKLDGLCFINLNCSNKFDVYKTEQTLVQVFTSNEGKQIDFLILSVLQDSKDKAMKLAIHFHDDKGQQQRFEVAFFNIDLHNNFLLRFTYDEKHKGQLIISHMDQSTCFGSKLQIKDYFKKQSNLKHQLNVALGGYFQSTTQQFVGNKGLQGLITNFVVLDGLLHTQVYNDLKVKVIENKEHFLLDFFEEQLHILQQDQKVEGDHFKQFQYLDIEKFKTAMSLMEIRDAMKIVKLVDKSNDNNFLVNMIRRSVAFKVTQEANTNVKTFYQGINCIEHCSLAEVFLSSENIEIIMFLAVITNQTYIDHCTQRNCSRKGIHHSHHEIGVFKIKHYFDKLLRKPILIMDYNKKKEDYVNCQQFQERLRSNQIKDCSIEPEDSPLRQTSVTNAFNTDSLQLITVNILPVDQEVKPAINQSDKQSHHLGQSEDFIDQSDQYKTPLQEGLQHQEQRAVSAFPTSENTLPQIISSAQNSTDRACSGTFQRKGKRMFTMNYSPPVQLRQFDIASMKKVGNYTSEQVKKKKGFHAEWIRIQAQYFGRIKFIEDKKILKFKTKGIDRPDEPFFVYGTLSYNLKKTQKVKLISISSILEVQTRRYSLKEIAIEIFCRNQKAYFFNLFQQDQLKKFIEKMKKINPAISFVIDRRQAFQQMDFTKKWVNGSLSNFEYLMQVNKYSGRSFNDLNQYPIFPWVIADYTSTKLDLNDPKTYRNLSKSIGAMNTERLENCKMKAESLKLTNNEYYLYGSHYSVAAQVINTLVRLEPFTTLQTELQDGKLDQPDRIFISIPNIWQSCQEDQQDFRELIPEYYYMPEFLMNINQVAFGIRQNNEAVGDVILPPWAENAYEFIELNRQALESEIVSRQLHSWINLIFGVHQNGEEAIKRDNVYHWLTYESCWQKIERCSQEEIQSYISQIQAFGQTPYQLFTKPLWQRTKNQQHLFPQPTEILISLKEFTQDPQKIVKFDKRITIKLFKSSSHHLLAVQQNKMAYRLQYQTNLQEDEPKSIDLQNAGKLHLESKPISSQVGSPSKINQNNNFYTGEQFAMNDEQQLFVCGYLSGTVYCFNMQNDNQLNISKIFKLHKERVKCLTYSSKLRTLCLGAKDHRVTVWKVAQTGEKTQYYNLPKYILYGHQRTICAVRIHEISESVISVDKAGVVIIHSIRSGIFLKEFKLQLKIHERVRKFEISQDGLIVFLTTFSEIIVTTINGLKQQKYGRSNCMITDFAIYERNHLLVSTIKGELLILLDVHLLSDTHPVLFHLYQNKHHNGILTFTYVKENVQSLVFLFSMMDGSILRYIIYNESITPMMNQLEKLGFATH